MFNKQTLKSNVCTAAQQATSTIVYRTDVVIIPLEIKKLSAEKRIARAKWQGSHTPSDKTAFNRLSSKPQIQT